MLRFGIRRVFSSGVGYPGAPLAPFTSELQALKPSQELAPTYRVLRPDGRGYTEGIRAADGFLSRADVSAEQGVSILKGMLSLRVLDDMCKHAQRQGRIPGYFPATGEEAAVVASGAALGADDEIFSQYREHGVLLYRLIAAGAQGQDSYLPFMRQNVGSGKDRARAVQMPMHYGSPELHFQMVSSTVATQLPNSVGASYALRGSPRIAATYLGDGGSSEGDFHAALGMAATLPCPVLFLCRNNGWAISTPTEQNYRSDGIAGRASGGYGIRAFRVDGNDALATLVAVRAARRYVHESQGPALVEMMTYRAFGHSTSDDPSTYRDDESGTYPEPLARMTNFAISQQWLTEEDLNSFVEEQMSFANAALETAESEEKPEPSALFADVYHKLPKSLQQQQKSLLDHLHTRALSGTNPSNV